MSDTQRLIECIAGYAETSVMGVDYQFVRDAYGRFVAPVYNIRHRECLLSVVHYRAVPDEPELLPQSVLGLGGEQEGDDGDGLQPGEGQQGDQPQTGEAAQGESADAIGQNAAQNTENADRSGENADSGTVDQQGEASQPELGLGGEQAEGQPTSDASTQQNDQQQSSRRRK